MKCLLCFLHDSYQSELKKLAQLQNSRFEDVIDTYEKIFINELQELSTTTCCHHGQEYLPNDYIKNLLGVLKKIDPYKISSFFNKIKEIYLLWIQSNSILAVRRLKELLDHYDLLEFKINISKKLMFRGRWNENNILTPYDMFHIPYDKRYLIGNQRYSLPGIPLLYLGLSPLDIFSELRIDHENNLNNLAISYFSFKNTDENFDVYDLTNDFYNILESNKGIEDILNVKNEEINEQNIEKMFFKFIFSCLCSFEKRIEQENNSYSMFHEEYIIPQILTQVLNTKSFKGIYYSSTKLNNQKNDFKHKSEYKNNVVLFTEYQTDRHYDFDLYKKFNISRPISHNNISKNEITIESLKFLYNFISDDKDVYLQKIYLNFNENFKDLVLDDNIEYNKHKIGEIHRFLIYNYLLVNKNRGD